MINTYIKQPKEIEAIQYTKETRQECIDFCNPRYTFMDNDGCLQESAHLFINTLEGEMMCKLSDYIIKGIKGEFYPCKEDIFNESYILK